MLTKEQKFAAIAMNVAGADGTTEKSEIDRIVDLAVANDLTELEKRLTLFHEKFYTMWHKENKTFGWEIQDARIGGLIQRAKTCKRRIEDYLSGRLENIEELEVELLAITKDKIYGNNYSRLISTSSI
jgi:hypothetical protein